MMVDVKQATFAVTMVGKRAVMSTARVDSDGDIIEAGGWELADFLANPIMLYEHRRDEPVGIWENMKADESGLSGEPIWHPEELNPFAARLEGLYKHPKRFLRGFSVKFLPLEMEPIVGTRGFRIKRKKLIECSCVSIPANGDTLLKSAADARIVPVFGASNPFATTEARTAGRKPEALTWRPQAAPSIETKTMSEAEIRALFKTMLDEMKQPATPQPEGNAPAVGADVADEEDDELAVKIAEAEADLAETEALIAEIEDEA